MTRYVYVLYESYRDDHNYPAHRYDMEVAYATEDLANAEAKLRNDKHNDGQRRINYESELRAWETKHADWEALVAAGRRPAGTEFQGRPEFRYEKVWFVEELEVIGITTTDGVNDG